MDNSEKINQTFELKFEKAAKNEIRLNVSGTSHGFYALNLETLDDINVTMRWTMTSRLTAKWRFEDRSGKK